MNTLLQNPVKRISPQAPSFTPAPKGSLQRKCVSDDCAERYKKKRPGLQTKLMVNKPGDMYELEADRIADQVMVTPEHIGISGTPIRIQRFSGQTKGQMDTAPASVNRVLASSGRPLDAALQLDMERRFGHDFSRVRVHTGEAAEQSARDVRAHAYTVGHNVVFGADQFAPEAHDGRRLLAHELTHVIQQSGTDGSRIDQSNLQRWSWAEIKEKAYDTMIAGIHKARDGMRNGLKHLAATYLPASLFPIADGIIEIAVTVVETLIAIIMAVLGIVVGFGEGIIGMIEGLFKLAYGVITLLYDLISGIFTNFDAARQDLNAVWEALKSLPSAVKKLVTDWLDKFGKASSERQSLMIGELTGQVLALIATFAVAAGRAGSAAKAAAATGDVTAGTGDVVATAARARPVLTVIEGGGGRGGGTVAQAAGPGAGDIVGSNALKVAPLAEPIAPPLRLVPPLPAEAAPAVAKAAALAPSGVKSVVAGAGVGVVTAAKAAPKPAPKTPSCDSPTGLTRASPIPMVWYKVREDDYYPKRLSLQGQVYGRDDPGNPRQLPLGEPLGVPNKYWPRLNKVMQLIPGDRGSKAADFRAVLARYGFDWSGLQADHVQDLDWGGPDAFENLWPLSDSANLSAGPRQNNHQRITYCETPEGPQVVNQTLNDFKLLPGHFGRYFRIDRVER